VGVRQRQTGGNTDMMARLASQDLSAKFGQPFVVENRPSAGGALGTRAVASASPDGYTLEFSASSVVTLTPQVQKLDFDPAKELVPITNVGNRHADDRHQAQSAGENAA